MAWDMLVTNQPVNLAWIFVRYFQTGLPVDLCQL